MKKKPRRSWSISRSISGKGDGDESGENLDQCAAARGIEDEFGSVEAMKYLVGEKPMNYLQAAEKDALFRAELPAFVAEIKTIFEKWQLAEYLEKAGWTEPFDPSLYDEDDEDYDPEFIEMERKDNLRRVANELLLLERAKEWLLEDDVSPEKSEGEPR